VAEAAGFQAAVSKGLDPGRYLAAHDATSFFEQIDGLVETGPIGTNVMDLVILIVKGKEER
jgi:glycerate-2-kinase